MVPSDEHQIRHHSELPLPACEPRGPAVTAVLISVSWLRNVSLTFATGSS